MEAKEKVKELVEKNILEIGDKVEVDGMGFMGFETYLGKIIGMSYNYYIIDFGESIIVEQRFQIRNKKYYEAKR